MKTPLALSTLFMACLLPCGMSSRALAELTIGNTTFSDTTTNATTAYDNDTLYLKYVRYMTYTCDLVNINGITMPQSTEWHHGDDALDILNSGNATWISANATFIANNAAALRNGDDITQVEIFTNMTVAPDSFSFANVTLARQTVTMRMQAINMMPARFNYYYHTGTNHIVNKVETEASDWEATTNTMNPYLFRQTGGSAYDAIVQLCNNPTWGDCLGAVMASVLWGEAAAEGSASFNAAFPGNTALSLQINNTQTVSWIYTAPQASEVYIPGDLVYFVNSNYNMITHLPVGSRFYKGTVTAEVWDGMASPVYTGPLLNSNNPYPWSGENSMYKGGVGHLFKGLGVDDQNANAMKDELVINYNADLAALILAGEHINGQTIHGIARSDILTEVSRPILPTPP